MRATEFLSVFYSDTSSKLIGFSLKDLDRLSESAGNDYLKFDQTIKRNLNLPNYSNTLEIYGIYLRQLNENKNSDNKNISDTEQALFDTFNTRAFDSISSAKVGDKVALLNLSTLNIPNHKIIAQLTGFLKPKKIVSIINNSDYQQLKFSDGSVYPNKDDAEIFQQLQTQNMTKLFASAETASKALLFYSLEGKKLSKELDFNINVDTVVSESHGYHFGFQGEETPRQLDAVNELKLRPQAVEPEELVDVYIRGKHRGEFISRSVAKAVSNKMIPAIVKRLGDKYNIRPEAIVYGPTTETVDEAVVSTAPGQASTTPVASRYDPAQLAATQQRLAATPVAQDTGRLSKNNIGIQTSAARG